MTTSRNCVSIKNDLSKITLGLVILLSIGCSNSGQFPIKHLGNSNGSSGIEQPSTDPTPENPTVPEVPTEPEIPTNPPGYKMQALAWESTKYPERTLWSQYLQKIILENWSSLLNGANDIETFCPRYHSLDNDQRANAWAQLFVAITKYESAYSPTSRMHESTMGKDPVTGKNVYSEGLLQLSYQDVQWARYCEFDWSLDKNLSATDPRKTILDPYKNLYCGVGIMAGQIKSKGSIVVSSGVYWAVIKSGGKYQQIANIRAIVKTLPLCK